MIGEWKQIAAHTSKGITLTQGMRLLAGAGVNFETATDTEKVSGWPSVPPGKELKAELEHDQ